MQIRRTEIKGDLFSVMLHYPNTTFFLVTILKLRRKTSISKKWNWRKYVTPSLCLLN